MRREKLFIDSGGWIALLNSSDTYHAEASAFYRNLDPATARISSSHVIGETYTWLRYKVGFGAASKFLSVIRKASSLNHLTIIFDNVDLMELAEQYLHDFHDQKISYTDALSMAMMQMEKITTVFGFDHHFNFLKFEVVPHTEKK